MIGIIPSDKHWSGLRAIFIGAPYYNSNSVVNSTEFCLSLRCLRTLAERHAFLNSIQTQRRLNWTING